jgi:hypothetical protein
LLSLLFLLLKFALVPWDFHPELLYKGRTWWQIILYVILGTLAGGTIGFIMAMRLSKKFNKRVRESKFFRNSVFANNPIVRKSLALPPVADDLSDLEHLYEEDEREAERESLKKGNGNKMKYESTS